CLTCLSLLRRPPCSSLFPYTTLFRSGPGLVRHAPSLSRHNHHMDVLRSISLFAVAAVAEIGGAWLIWQGVREHRGVLWMGLGVRSEEHTSELQSRENLVCRLLLEKKN